MNNSLKRLIFWIADGVIAVFSILAIVGYFFSPFWSVTAHYAVQGDMLKQAVTSVDGLEDVDFDAIAGENGIPVSLTVELRMGDLISGIGADGENTVEAIVNNNADKIVNQLSGTLDKLLPEVTKSVAKEVVKQEVQSSVKDFLSSQEPSADVSNEAVTERLEKAGITDEFISEKTDEVIDALFTDGGTVSSVTDQVMDVVDDVFEQFAKCDDETLKDLKLTEEDKTSIRDTVTDVLEKLADENGNIDPATMIEQLLAEALKGLNGNGTAPTAAEEPAPDRKADVKAELKTYIMNNIPSSVFPYIRIAMIVLLALYAFSSIFWVYTLVKLLVKLITRPKDNTVKLKGPIVLGWLPFLLFVALPSLAVLLVKSGAFNAMLGEQIVAQLAYIEIAFASSGWIALLAACVCFAAFILFAVMRRIKAGSAEASEDSTAEAA